MFILDVNIVEIHGIERSSLICNSALQRQSLSAKLHGAKGVCLHATTLIHLF